MHWLIEIQRWLYGGMWEGMKATANVSGLPALMGAEPTSTKANNVSNLSQLGKRSDSLLPGNK